MDEQCGMGVFQIGVKTRQPGKPVLFPEILQSAVNCFPHLLSTTPQAKTREVSTFFGLRASTGTPSHAEIDMPKQRAIQTALYRGYELLNADLL